MGVRSRMRAALLRNTGVLRSQLLRSAPQPPMFAVSRLLCDAAASSSEVAFGTVKWFDVKKGFGFITPESGGPDVFVHQTEIHSPGFRSLADGEEVEFKLVSQDDGRYRASDVTGPEGNYVRGAAPPSLPDQGQDTL